MLSKRIGTLIISALLMTTGSVVFAQTYVSSGDVSPQVRKELNRPLTMVYSIIWNTALTAERLR